MIIAQGWTRLRDYAAQVTCDPNRVGDVTFDQRRAHSDEAQIVKLTWCITLCTFLNKFNEMMKLDMEEKAAVFHQDSDKDATL